jgi:hypothetical protein
MLSPVRNPKHLRLVRRSTPERHEHKASFGRGGSQFRVIFKNIGKFYTPAAWPARERRTNALSSGEGQQIAE